jgi:hypothetical protein
LAS